MKKPNSLSALAAVAALSLAALAAPASAQTRNPFLQPFSNTSIWNTPLGSGAQYHAINLPQLGQNRTDWEYLSATNSSDPTYQWIWSGVDTENVVMHSYDPVINSSDDEQGNGIVAVVQPNGTVYQANGANRAANAALYGILIGFPYRNPYAQTTDTGTGYFGAHTGSGLSGLGGSVRQWELQLGGDYSIQHPLKIELDQNLLWKNPSNASQSYVWPADRCDGNTGGYGAYKDDPALTMGSLLALPPSLTPSSLGLQTEVGIKLFHALQDYGAYVVDTSGTNFSFPNHNYIATFCEERAARSTFNMDCDENTGGAFYHDLNALYTNLQAVTNNTASSMGGGGSPRRPAAPSGFSGPPIGHRITLYSQAAGHYVSNEINVDSTLRAGYANSIGAWEIYDVYDAGNGMIALKSEANGKYVTCNLNNNDELQGAYATTIQAWEEYLWWDDGNGEISLSSPASGYYVSCDLYDNNMLLASYRTDITNWEQFQWQDLGTY